MKGTGNVVGDVVDCVESLQEGGRGKAKAECRVAGLDD